jgi:hypothetical protein
MISPKYFDFEVWPNIKLCLYLKRIAINREEALLSFMLEQDNIYLKNHTPWRLEYTYVWKKIIRCMVPEIRLALIILGK